METQKQEVSWLEKFPPDIWAYLVRYLPVEQLGRLAITGSVLLSLKLKSPHVVVSIKLGQDHLTFKSFPGFLNDFPYLEELCIHSKNYDWSQGLRLTIDSIPSGVRKLGLSGYWNPEKLFGEDGSTLKLNEHLPHLESLDWYALMFASYTWLSHSPQSLTKLNLRRWDGTVDLPSSLIHFHACIVYLSRDTSFASKLPPSLETFLATSLRGVELIVPLLPSTTRKLSLGDDPRYSDGLRSQRNLLAELPKSLTWLDVPHLTEISFETNPELTSLLPATLTELSINPDFPCSAWPLLPQQLTSLSFQATGSLCTVVSKMIDDDGIQHEAQSIPFDTLPRFLRRITMGESLGSQCFCGPPTVSNRTYFPPQLEYLSIRSVQLSPEASKLIPSSLTSLEIGHLCERVCRNLPNGLQTLIAHKTLMSPDLIKFLPKSLTFLHVTVARSDDPWFDHNTGKKIDCISNLPEYSIHKSCMSQAFDWKDYSPLPPRLISLYINDAHDVGDSFFKYQQLPNLLELSIETSQHLTDLCIPLLPRHLTYLNLSSASQISGKSFKYLPRGLVSLNLASSKSIFDSDIQHLPRALKSAHLNHAIELTESCLLDLPPHLEWLEMRYNSKITPLSFSTLPQPLRSIRLF